MSAGSNPIRNAEELAMLKRCYVRALRVWADATSPIFIGIYWRNVEHARAAYVAAGGVVSELPQSERPAA